VDDAHAHGASALVTANREYTPKEYNEAVDRAATRLEGLGVTQGTVLGIALDPSPEFLFVLQAAFHIGAIACPLNPRWPPSYLEARLKQAGCTRVVDLVDIKDRSDRSDTYAIPSSKKDLLERPATVIFTSGSAREPKAALHTYGNHYWNAIASNQNIPLHPGDRWLLSLPLYHVAGIGIMFRCMLAGAAVAIPDRTQPLGQAIRQLGATHVSLVATQLHRLLDDPDAVATLAGIKAILLGGSAMSGNLIRRAHARGLPIHTSYGLTEMASQVTTTRAGDALDVLLTSGRPLADDTVLISEDGEILVRGKTLFQGYIENGTVTRPLTPGGWFATGDIGRIDANDCITVSGRKDNQFVVGGENLQPEAIERVLCRIENIDEAVVVPIADAEFGCLPVAFIQSEALDVNELRDRLAQALPRHAIPRHFLAWPEETASSESKVNRREFKARAEAALDRSDQSDQI